MSTHNICFHGEIRKISAFFGRKKRSVCCFEIFDKNIHENIKTKKVQHTLVLKTRNCVLFIAFESIYFFKHVFRQKKKKHGLTSYVVQDYKNENN